MIEIYRPKIEQLPSFLKEDPDGLLVVDESFIKEGQPGPYHLVMNFEHSRDCLREPVPLEERITTNTREDLTFLGFGRPEITSAMRKITDLANDPDKSYLNPEDRRKYRAQLKYVYQALAGEVQAGIGDERVLVFPPKNGGIFVQEVYEECGFPKKDFFDYRMSRILGKDESLMVGIDLAEFCSRIVNYQVFVFADDCLASDVSAWGTLEIIKEEFEKGEIPKSEIRVIIAVSATTQRGLESLLSEESKRHFGFKRIEAIAGIPVFQMTENFYLQHPDGKYVVGDMGRWTLGKR